MAWRALAFAASVTRLRNIADAVWGFRKFHDIKFMVDV
jgi:hypothetical protein